ncbi:MAG: hypothetical protein LBE65_06945 [Synergistaceae bacterium]|jgi:hypothetical protein|nr:hypothetical protein [Synergistaceae bacterium]
MEFMMGDGDNGCDSRYTKNGRIIPLGGPTMPDGLKVMITILDGPFVENRSSDQKKAFEEFRNGLAACAPLPPEFDDIVSERVRSNAACWRK